MLMPYQRRWDLNKLLATLNHQLVCDLNHLQLNAQHIPIFIAPCGWWCFGWTNRTGHRWGNMIHADWEGQLIGCSSWTVWMGKTMLRFDWRCSIFPQGIHRQRLSPRFTSIIIVRVILAYLADTLLDIHAPSLNQLCVMFFLGVLPRTQVRRHIRWFRSWFPHCAERAFSPVHRSCKFIKTHHDQRRKILNQIVTIY